MYWPVRNLSQSQQHSYKTYTPLAITLLSFKPFFWILKWQRQDTELDFDPNSYLTWTLPSQVQNYIFILPDTAIFTNLFATEAHPLILTKVDSYKSEHLSFSIKKGSITKPVDQTIFWTQNSQWFTQAVNKFWKEREIRSKQPMK